MQFISSHSSNWRLKVHQEKYVCGAAPGSLIFLLQYSQYEVAIRAQATVWYDGILPRAVAVYLFSIRIF